MYRNIFSAIACAGSPALVIPYPTSPIMISPMRIFSWIATFFLKANSGPMKTNGTNNSIKHVIIADWSAISLSPLALLAMYIEKPSARELLMVPPRSDETIRLSEQFVEAHM